MTEAEANRDQSAHWNDLAGRNWVKLQPLLDRMFAPIVPSLLDALPTRRPLSILDIGCGAGALTLAAIERAGPGAACLGIDVSAPLIEAARERAKAAGIVDAHFVEADAQTFAFKDGRVDLVLSRFGVMFFDDPVAAFANLRRAAKPGARLRFVAWRRPGENPFMMAGRQAAAGLVELPTAAPDAPGQFGFADRERVLGILSASGWTRATVEPLDVACALPARDIPVYATHLGPLGPLWPGLDPDMRERLQASIRVAFAPFVDGEEASFTAACWIADATA